MQQITDIDRARLRADLKASAARSAALKRALRSTWKKPMADEQYEHVLLRRRITSLCILSASLRGRYHLSKPLREGAYPGMKWDRAEYHARVAASVAREYASDATSPSGASSRQEGSTRA